MASKFNFPDQFTPMLTLAAEVSWDPDGGHQHRTIQAALPIHKYLLCTRVPYFRKLFESTFKEGAEQAETLPEDDPNAFVLFVQWLYRDGLTPLDIQKYDLPPKRHLP